MEDAVRATIKDGVFIITDVYQPPDASPPRPLTLLIAVALCVAAVLFGALYAVSH